MLKSRIITATFIIITVLAIIFYAPPLLQAVSILLICFVLGYEWLRMIGAKTPQKILFYVALIVCELLLYFKSHWLGIALWVSVIGWVFAIISILFYQNQRMLWPSNVWLNTLIGLWLIVPFGAGTFFLLDYFLPKMFLFLLLGIACADSFAYFSGRLCGRLGSRHLLSSRVSPGKSWEGVLGGMICTALVFYVVLDLILNVMTWQFSAFMVFVIIPVSIIGDLFESMVKRIYGVKDSGKLLPGHGGLLDRLDSLTAAVPVFTWCFIYLPKSSGY